MTTPDFPRDWDAIEADALAAEDAREERVPRGPARHRDGRGCVMVLTGFFTPISPNPGREHSLVEVLTETDNGYTVKGYDGETWSIERSEIEALVKEDV